jgi:hypothetical protein
LLPAPALFLGCPGGARGGARGGACFAVGAATSDEIDAGFAPLIMGDEHDFRCCYIGTRF